MECAVITTYRCNAHCQMCNISQNPTHRLEEFSPEVLAKLPGGMRTAGQLPESSTTGGGHGAQGLKSSRATYSPERHTMAWRSRNCLVNCKEVGAMEPKPALLSPDMAVAKVQKGKKGWLFSLKARTSQPLSWGRKGSTA